MHCINWQGYLSSRRIPCTSRHQEAAECFVRGAEAGDWMSLDRLKRLCARGAAGGVEIECAKALQSHETFAEQQENASAMCFLGSLYFGITPKSSIGKRLQSCTPKQRVKEMSRRVDYCVIYCTRLLPENGTRQGL